MCRYVLDCYHFHLNHLRGGRLVNNAQKLCYCKLLLLQVEMYENLYKIYQLFKNNARHYGNYEHKTIVDQNLSNVVHIELIVLYAKKQKTDRWNYNTEGNYSHMHEHNRYVNMSVINHTGTLF